ncbi:hypothetical protein BASA61_007845 [Batrachochytrium salamandrivorans]|nr:hypothetical protein BASA60_004471 [Batrachochytrium salamandrivorans]KAH6576825.1 hypothetical protein BASA62_001165 [Batrachochytrium salamandrivorans]KAH6583786.1 hypothetical protein BASA61_007845 [Batrachochytrium salamandrivorans]
MDVSGQPFNISEATDTSTKAQQAQQDQHLVEKPLDYVSEFSGYSSSQTNWISDPFPYTLLGSHPISIADGENRPISSSILVEPATVELFQPYNTQGVLQWRNTFTGLDNAQQNPHIIREAVSNTNLANIIYDDDLFLTKPDASIPKFPGVQTLPPSVHLPIFGNDQSVMHPSLGGIQDIHPMRHTMSGNMSVALNSFLGEGGLSTPSTAGLMPRELLELMQQHLHYDTLNVTAGSEIAPSDMMSAVRYQTAQGVAGFVGSNQSPTIDTLLPSFVGDYTIPSIHESSAIPSLRHGVNCHCAACLAIRAHHSIPMLSNRDPVTFHTPSLPIGDPHLRLNPAFIMSGLTGRHMFTQYQDHGTIPHGAGMGDLLPMGMPSADPHIPIPITSTHKNATLLLASPMGVDGPSTLSPAIPWLPAPTSEQQYLAGPSPSFRAASSSNSGSDPSTPGYRILSAVEKASQNFWGAIRTPSDINIRSLRSVVEAFLDPASQEFTIVLVHPRVVQKSYGKEKRFFCPQPILHLIGSSWTDLIGPIPTKPSNTTEQPYVQTEFVDNDHLWWPEGSHRHPYKRTQQGVRSSISENTKHQHSQSDSQPSLSSSSYRTLSAESLGADFALNPMVEDSDPLADDEGGEVVSSCHGVKCNLELERRRVSLLSKTSSFGRYALPSMQSMTRCASAISKGLYISDSDTRKSFHLNFKIYGTVPGKEVCRVRSKEIKVISKPSRNKSTAKSTEYTICSGHYIALFNRVRSQTVSTRYMTVSQDGSKLSSRHTPWDTFIIWLESDPAFISRSANKGNNQRGPIESDVPLIVRRVDGKSTAVVQELESPKNRLNKSNPSSLFHHADYRHGPPDIKTKDAVSQLHKIALQVKSQPSHYISLRDENIVTYEAKPNLASGMDEASVDPDSAAIYSELDTVTSSTGASDPHELPRGTPIHQGRKRSASIVRKKTLPTLLKTRAKDRKSTLLPGRIEGDRNIEPSIVDQSSPPRDTLRSFKSYEGSDIGSNAETITEEVTELSVWSIVSTEIVEHTFSLPPLNDTPECDIEDTAPFAMDETMTQPILAESGLNDFGTHFYSPNSLSPTNNPRHRDMWLGTHPMPIVDSIKKEDTNVLVCTGLQLGPHIWIFAGLFPAKRVTIRSTTVFMVEFECPIEIASQRSIAHLSQRKRGSVGGRTRPLSTPSQQDSAHTGNRVDHNTWQNEGLISETVPLLVVRDQTVFRTQFCLTLRFSAPNQSI